MYEAEVNRLIEPAGALPAEVLARFAEYRSQVELRTTLPWGEHCTECAAPACYTSCELYSRREDGACRQFVGGMVRIDHKNGLNPYILKLHFKQWAELWTVGNLDLRPVGEARRRELVNITVGALSRHALLPSGLRTKMQQKVNYVRRRMAQGAPAAAEPPDCFLLECYNPGPQRLSLTLTLTMHPVSEGYPLFQRRIELPQGYVRARVPFAEIAAMIDCTRPFSVNIIPQGGADPVLYFGLMDFVREAPAARAAQDSSPQGKAAKGKKLKCLVWDLDNTLWDGVLIEDGPDGIRLRPEMAELIREADERGILHSIASKNNHDDVMEVLRRFGLEEYFLYPQIHWQPKSGSLTRIAELINIGIDTLVFVDDQPFERAEVSSAHPDVDVLDVTEIGAIRQRPEWSVQITAESRQRRLMYREGEKREQAARDYAGVYEDFLRDCQIRVSLSPLNEQNLKRVYELAQRTNQMNFSGNRYQEAQLRDLMQDPEIETFVIDCVDKFGSYGIVGFAVIDTREPRLQDLMFSCRVQGKKVEHAVLRHFLRRFADGRTFYATFRQTPKNANPGKVFAEVGFEPAGAPDLLRFPHRGEIPEDAIISIVDRTHAGQAIENCD